MLRDGRFKQAKKGRCGHPLPSGRAAPPTGHAPFAGKRGPFPPAAVGADAPCHTIPPLSAAVTLLCEALEEGGDHSSPETGDRPAPFAGSVRPSRGAAGNWQTSSGRQSAPPPPQSAAAAFATGNGPNCAVAPAEQGATATGDTFSPAASAQRSTRPQTGSALDRPPRRRCEALCRGPTAPARRGQRPRQRAKSK